VKETGLVGEPEDWRPLTDLDVVGRIIINECSRTGVDRHVLD